MVAVANGTASFCTHPALQIRYAEDAHRVFEAVRLGMLPLIRRRLTPSERELLASGQVFVWEEASSAVAADEGSNAGGLERWTDGRRWSQSRMREPFLYYEEKGQPTQAEKQAKDFRRTRVRNASPFTTNAKSASIFRGGQSPREDSASESSSIRAIASSSNPDSNANEEVLPTPGTEPCNVKRQDRPSKPDGLTKQTYSSYVHVNGNLSSLPKKWHIVAYFSSTDNTNGTLPGINSYPDLKNLHIPEGVYVSAKGLGRGGVNAISSLPVLRVDDSRTKNDRDATSINMSQPTTSRIEPQPTFPPHIRYPHNNRHGHTSSISSSSTTSSPPTPLYCATPPNATAWMSPGRSRTGRSRQKAGRDPYKAIKGRDDRHHRHSTGFMYEPFLADHSPTSNRVLNSKPSQLSSQVSPPLQPPPPFFAESNAYFTDTSPMDLGTDERMSAAEGKGAGRPWLNEQHYSFGRSATSENAQLDAYRKGRRRGQLSVSAEDVYYQATSLPSEQERTFKRESNPIQYHFPDRIENEPKPIPPTPGMADMYPPDDRARHAVGHYPRYHTDHPMAAHPHVPSAMDTHLMPHPYTPTAQHKIDPRGASAVLSQAPASISSPFLNTLHGHGTDGGAAGSTMTMRSREDVKILDAFKLTL